MAINPISSVAISAYRNALGQVQGVENQVAESLGKTDKPKGGFMDALKKSVAEVNAEQIKKDNMVEAFASGENQNIHELMIQLQKAGLAMSMTSAVRNKVLDTYKELVRMSF